VKNGFNNLKYSERRVITCLMVGIVVLAVIGGVMVDVDHPLAQLLGIRYGRFLHPYFAVAGLGLLGLGIILFIACLCRFLQLRLLKKKDS
jgi:hypothetical protein